MGSQHYSCRLRLSRKNLYILYINRTTERKLPFSSGFPQGVDPGTELAPLPCLGSFHLKTPGLHPPEAIPKVALPARAGAESLLSNLNVSEKGLSLRGDGRGKAAFQPISPGSKFGRQGFTRQFLDGRRSEIEAYW